MYVYVSARALSLSHTHTLALSLKPFHLHLRYPFILLVQFADVGPVMVCRYIYMNTRGNGVSSRRDLAGRIQSRNLVFLCCADRCQSEALTPLKIDLPVEKNNRYNILSLPHEGI